MSFNASSLDFTSLGVKVGQGVYFTLDIAGLVLLFLVLVTFAFQRDSSRNSSLVAFLGGLSINALGQCIL